MTRDELASWWRSFGETECRGYSPLYDAICAAVADADAVLDRLIDLPDHALQPNMLLAGVHDLVLRGDAPRLAQCYDEADVAGAPAAFLDVVQDSWDRLVPLLEARRTQTNEIGRVAVLAPALAAVAGAQAPTVVDVGTSAGLTLTLERCHIDYGSSGRLGPPDSPVRVVCEVLHGDPPIRPTPVARRIGLDRRPLDPTDRADARWLLACTWPDTGRLERTRAAVELAAAHPPELRTGDAVADLPALLAELDGPLVVTTTWVLAYLSPQRRGEFLDVLAAASVDRPVSWIGAEAPGVVVALPPVEPPEVDGASASVLGAISAVGGTIADARVLAHAHPHGRWLWWHEG